MIDVKVAQVGEPVATTEPTSATKLKTQFNIDEIRKNVRCRIAKEFPRLTTSKHGDQRIATLVAGILEDTKVQTAAQTESEHSNLLADVEREARHRCDKCHFPMAPYDNACRICEVRLLRDRNHNVEVMLRSAIRTLHRTSKDIEAHAKDGELQLNKAQLEQLQYDFWRVYSLIAAALEEPSPAASTVPMDLWAAMPMAGLTVNAIMSALRSGWMSSSSSEPKK